ncbi:MAG: zf-HC2 domain-containing protein [Deltaproteobacteria bacterium]|nr:zf-HC2 domain-containing protein [Deltaproteobacteria bacterium]
MSEELTALLDGELSALERARVEEHLRSCPACAAERASLEAALGSLARVEAIEPSPELRRRVLARVAVEPEGLLARFRALFSVRFLVPVTAAVAAALVLMLAQREEGPAASDLEVAEWLELLQDYDVVAVALPTDIPPADLDVVAHLHELGE